MKQPLVSVLMPVFNAADHVAEALKSILQQDYRELEIIIVNDACTDNTLEIIHRLADSRVKILHNPANSGLAASLNLAIQSASGEYLARMDADDIAHRLRISKQVAFMNAHPDVDVLGTAMQYFGASRYLNYFPESHQACKAQLLFNVCFGHPTVMFRKRVFGQPSNLYNPELRQYSEEYELWCRLVNKFTFHNLKEVLLFYRTYPLSEKVFAEQKRLNNTVAIRTKFLTDQLGFFDQPFIDLHNKAASMQDRISYQELKEINKWFNDLVQRNESKLAFDPQALKQILAIWFFEICYKNAGITKPVMFQFFFSGWTDYYKPDIKLMSKFIVKHLIRR